MTWYYEGHDYNVIDAIPKLKHEFLEIKKSH